AEDRLGHRANHVDVEPLDLAVERVEVTEVVRALVHPGDEVAALADLGHERAVGYLRRAKRGEAGGRGVARRGGGLAAGPRLARCASLGDRAVPGGRADG